MIGRSLAVTALAAVLLAGCTADDAPEVGATPLDRPAEASVGAPRADGDLAWLSTTPPSGNRQVTIPPGATAAAPEHVRHDLADTPSWLVSAPVDGGILHVLTNGASVVAAVVVGDVAAGPVDPNLLGPVAPGRPALVAVDGRWQFHAPQEPTNGEPAVPLPDGTFGWVDGEGVVHLGDLEVPGALPDARLAVSADGRAAWLADPTDRYGHGVLGDEFEAGRILVADPATGQVVVDEGVDPGVVEGTGVLWGDVDGDGRDDLLYTSSRTGEGARLVVRRDDGSTITGPPIGASSRWRHQIAVAPGPDGVAEVVEVVTPHLARIATWWRVEGVDLVVAMQVEGAVASHTLGSRNLDQAVVADLTGDGVADLVGPGAGGGLVVVDRNGGSVALLDDGQVVTNVTVTVSGTRVQVAAATADALHVFQWGG